MKSAICTLFEGDYHYGVGALVNSLYHYGFRGDVWVGYRGDLPPWAKSAIDCGQYLELEVADRCLIKFIKLNTTYHLTNYKPMFMLRLWNNFCTNTEALFYFDPDIVIKCSWEFYERWVTYGIALCQDVVWASMPSNHPIRMGWKKHAEVLGYKSFREINQYFNAGFLGLTKDFLGALSVWNEIINYLETIGIDLTTLQQSGPTSSFFANDQDALNLMLMIVPYPLSTIGPEGMDFIPCGFTMSHAAGQVKSWRKNLTLAALQGQRPTLADRGYFRHIRTPIKLYNEYQFFVKSADMFVARVLGRFLHSIFLILYLIIILVGRLF